ncbi:MAG: hypothetical protein C4527_01340 [Candidatus Omnitrophota bacterium]|jgi:hypothetical protein|nr:MAG: hypothetical protein C4527_01340 [Candidatus Omnitrophota bacterium]
MNLYALLSQIPHESLQQLAGEFGISTFTPSKRNLINEISGRYRDSKFMADMVEELSPDGRGFLYALAFFADPSSETFSIPRELIMARCVHISETILLQELFDKGLLFHPISDNEQTVFFPNEIRRMVRSLLLEKYSFAPTDTNGNTEPRYHPALESLFHLLSILSHTRGKCTQHGTLHQKTIELWNQRFYDGEPDKKFFHFVFSFAQRNELIELHNHHYQVTAKGLAWFNDADNRLHQHVWSYLLETEIIPRSDLQQLVILLKSLAETVKNTQAVPHFSILELNKRYASYNQTDSFVATDHSATILADLQLLEWIGIITLDSPKNPAVFTFTKLGRRILFEETETESTERKAHEGCTLQANYEILLPPTVDYATLWKIDQMAEFRRRDIMTKYCVTRQSVTHAMRLGWTTQNVMDFIEKLTLGRIPEIVRFSLEEWCTKYGQITFRRVILIECISRELADEITHIPSIHELFEQRISERYFTVKETHAKSLFRLMQNHGYEPAHFRREDP